eukprot:4609977-Amphidinium_carterae.1
MIYVHAFLWVPDGRRACWPTLAPCDALQHSAAMGEESLLGLGHATVVPGGLHVSLQASEPALFAQAKSLFSPDAY